MIFLKLYQQFPDILIMMILNMIYTLMLQVDSKYQLKVNVEILIEKFLQIPNIGNQLPSKSVKLLAG